MVNRFYQNLKQCGLRRIGKYSVNVKSYCKIYSAGISLPSKPQSRFSAANVAILVRVCKEALAM